MSNIAVVRFNSGEVTSKIDTRKDIEDYVGGCRRCENMIPDLYGNATRRPGTEFITTSVSLDGTYGSGIYGSGIYGF